MNLSGFYGGSNLYGMSRYKDLVKQLPDNLRCHLEEVLGMISFLEYEYDITHLGTTKRVILEINADKFKIEFSIWINKTNDDIDAIELLINSSRKRLYDKFRKKKFDDVFETLNNTVSGKELK